MDANQACNVLLSNLKESNLNWNLVESPFSLTINLKKSFIKDSEGNPWTGFTKQHYNQNGHHDNLKHVIDENNSLNKALANMKQEKDELMEILDAK